MPAFKCFHTACAHRKWDDLNRLVPELPEPSFIDELNRDHAVVSIEGKARILNENPRADGGKDITFSTFSDFKQLYMAKVKTVIVRDKKHTIHLADKWLRSPRRRQFKRVVFEPDTRKCGLQDYNLFSGFSTEPKTGGSWDLFNQHLLDNVCKGDPSHHEWLVTWIARIIQRPGSKRPGTAVVLRGGQGTGKSIVGTTIGRLVSPYFAHLTMAKHLTGNFNAHLKDKLLVFADEAFFAGDRSNIGRLKALISEEQLTVEPKGLDAISVSNHINVLMASNEDWVIPAEADERRYFMLDISSARAKDTGYFGRMLKQLDDGGYEAMAYDLLHWDLSRANLWRAPATDALMEQKEVTLGSVAQFWVGCLDEQHILRADADLLEIDDGVGWPTEVSKRELFNGYCLFCRRQGVRYKHFAAQFWRVLRRLVGELEEHQRGTGIRERVVVLPDYTSCLNKWRKVLNTQED
jgi:hypothetical protein